MPMKYSVKYKRVFDKDGNIVNISTVNEANRLSEYYSIGSHTPMIAALGQTNQHYFRAKRGYQLNPETELHEYVKNVLKHRFETEDQIGMLFASNSYAKPFVFDKAISQDGRSFVMMGKDIYGALNPWVIYVITWNGKTYHYKVSSHFDYESALKDFTIRQGKTWHGGETSSDQCK